jgi:hypothetical protein
VACGNCVLMPMLADIPARAARPRRERRWLFYTGKFAVEHPGVDILAA